MDSFGKFMDPMLLSNYIFNDHGAIQNWISIHTGRTMLCHDSHFAALAECINQSENVYSAAKLYVDNPPTYKKKGKKLKAKMYTTMYNKINSVAFQSYSKMCNTK